MPLKFACPTYQGRVIQGWGGSGGGMQSIRLAHRSTLGTASEPRRLSVAGTPVMVRTAVRLVLGLRRVGQPSRRILCQELRMDTSEASLDIKTDFSYYRLWNVTICLIVLWSSTYVFNINSGLFVMSEPLRLLIEA